MNRVSLGLGQRRDIAELSCHRSCVLRERVIIGSERVCSARVSSERVYSERMCLDRACYYTSSPSSPMVAKNSDKVSKFATDFDSSATWSLNSSLQRFV